MRERRVAQCRVHVRQAPGNVDVPLDGRTRLGMPVDAVVQHVHKKSSSDWQRILHIFSETFHPWQPPQPGLFCQWHSFLVILFWQIYFLLTGLRHSTALCTDLPSCCSNCTASLQVLGTSLSIFSCTAGRERGCKARVGPFSLTFLNPAGNLRGCESLKV
jgi:hypothetical protein